MAMDSRLLTGFADNPAMVDMVTRQLPDGWRQVDLLIPDMRCSNCAARLQLLQDDIPGLRDLRLNPARHHLGVDYDPKSINLTGLLSAIEEAGYTPSFMALPDDDPRLRAQRRTHLKRLGVAGMAMMQVMMLSIALYAGEFQGIEPFYERMWQWVGFLFTTPVVFYSSVPFFRNAWYSLRDLVRKGGKQLGLAMDVPVALAIAAAYLASVWATVTGTGEVYYDSVTMFAFLLLGARFLEQSLRHRLARFDNLLSMLPETVQRQQSGQFEDVPLRQVKAGDVLLVRPGSRVPLDGEIISGSSELDESTLTGESDPVHKQQGAQVFAGTLNLSQPLQIRALVRSTETRMAAIQRLAERASLDRPGIVALTERIAKVFVIVVLGIAAITYLAWYPVDPHKALWSAIAVLVVACPCALSLATPSAITAATLALRRAGFIVTKGHVLERLAQIDTVIFDKTGTLTTATPSLQHIELLTDPTMGRNRQHCLSLALALEQQASHPLARGFAQSGAEHAQLVFTHVNQHPGAGVEGYCQGRHYRLGNAAFCNLAQVPAAAHLTRVYLTEDDRPLCHFDFSAGLRSDAIATVRALQARNLKVQILTGDAEAPAQAISQALGKVQVQARMTPEAKLAALQQLQQQGARVILIGDGINDVPALSAAALSVAPLEATDLAKNSSDALLLSKGLAPLVAAFQTAAHTRRVIRQNLLWAFAYNMSTLPLAALGLLPPWMAAVGMSASSLLVMLNSMRLTQGKSAQDAPTNPAPAAPINLGGLAWKS